MVKQLKRTQEESEDVLYSWRTLGKEKTETNFTCETNTKIETEKEETG